MTDMICFILLEMMIFDIQYFGLDVALTSSSFLCLSSMLVLILVLYAVFHSPKKQA